MLLVDDLAAGGTKNLRHTPRGLVTLQVFLPMSEDVLFCQPRVEVTSCFVYKVMGLTFHDRINTQMIYRFELAQVVARRIKNYKEFFLGSNLTGCSFFIKFFFYFRGEEGGGVSDFIIRFMSYFSFLFIFLL